MDFEFGITFDDLYRRDGLVKLDAAFVNKLKDGNVPLFNRFMAARADRTILSDKDHSQLLIELAPHVEDFIGTVFGIEKEIRALAEKHHALSPLYACKRLFVQRRAAKALKLEEAARIDPDALLSLLPLVPYDDSYFELVFSKVVMSWLEKEEEHKSLLEIAARYAGWALLTQTGQARHGKGLLFKQPKKLDPLNLVPCETQERDGVQVMFFSHHHHRSRDGFKLTDDAGTLAQALDQAHYCIFCHNQGKDSCSKGMREKTGEFKKNSLDITLAGCPLEEKISEMNTLKAEGVPLGALAMVTVDNPMCAGTGHRICNDCMKSCIYQKQEPVNIPHVETYVLKNILALPYGFEIYSLLTRWNPLNLARPLPRAQTGRNVLVSGLGPSGYTLAHHLLNDGHTVIGIDGLKIEPVAAELSGVDAKGARVPFVPIKDISLLYEALDERSLAGFGGVAEYGITVRWDKNYLKIIRLLLERREQFSMFGGVRFGSAITYENVFAFGFDHVALCMGAGKPTMIDMKNGVSRGVRAASDFLMSLQLTGAAKKDSIANLQLRLPAVVIGGGLTAIDTATEALAYYPIQVEKFLHRYEALIAERGEKAVRALWSAEDQEIAEEFLAHGKEIVAERARAAKENRTPNFWPLLDQWGGVKLIYRKRLIDAPSYRLNHEEVEKAFEEGIFFAECFEPKAVEVDQYGHAKAIRLKKARHSREGGNPDLAQEPDDEILLPARAILVAAGTNPNTVLQREDPEHFELDGRYFRAVDETGNPVKPERISKPKDVRVLMSLDGEGRAVSFFGDLHPSFAGNVVKAMASAKQGYPVVTRIMEKRPAAAPQKDFLKVIKEKLRATVHLVNRLTPNIIEVIIHAPLAAEAFKPGQFYRLQNYEAYAPRIEHAGTSTTLAMEGLAMTGAWVDKQKGLISVIALEMGGSSDLCAYLKPGEPVVLMGPTGTPTEIEPKETVLLVGGGLGNAVLFSIGKEMREKGCTVLYFAGYKKAIDRYKLDEIEAAADQVIWCCDEALLPSRRAQDSSFHGNIVEAILAYGAGSIGVMEMRSDGVKITSSTTLPPHHPITPPPHHSTTPIPLNSVSRIIAIGSDRMMAAIASARHGVLAPYLNPAHVAIGSINSPMQCMMKEICAQCLQKHIDPKTGAETYIYSCFNQDQLLDNVSFPHLRERLLQNSLQEKLTAQWIDACLKALEWRRAA